jgi:hypothetical protein
MTRIGVLTGIGWMTGPAGWPDRRDGRIDGMAGQALS